MLEIDMGLSDLKVMWPVSCQPKQFFCIMNNRFTFLHSRPNDYSRGGNFLYMRWYRCAAQKGHFFSLKNISMALYLQMENIWIGCHFRWSLPDANNLVKMCNHMAENHIFLIIQLKKIYFDYQIIIKTI